MIDKIYEHKEDILRIAKSYPEVVCIAMVNDKLLIGTALGKEDIVSSMIEEEFKQIGLDYVVGWEVTVARYPIFVYKNGAWCLG